MDTLGTFLASDHERCDALLRATQRSVAAAAWPQARCDVAAFQRALDRHMLIEERVIFSAFERAVGHAMSPTGAMRAEHLRIRVLVQRLADAVEANSTHDFVKHAEALLLTMHLHSEREEGVLYPVIERMLGSRCADLLDAARNFGALDDGANEASCGN